MKKPLSIITLTVLLCFTSIFAKEWSAEQKEVLDAFNSYIAASLKGNIEGIMAFLPQNCGCYPLGFADILW